MPRRILYRGNKPVSDRSGSDLAGTIVAPRNATELELARIWEEILDIHPVGVTDDFFELGGDSFSAVSLMVGISESVGRDLPPEAFFQRPTIERFADILYRESASRGWSPLVAIQPRGPKRPFFCVHASGGHVLVYHALARHLGLDQPFYGLRALGQEDGQQPHARIEDMAACYVDNLRCIQPEGPYLLGGWCFGALVAFEMAHILLERGDQVELLALIEGPVPGTAPRISVDGRRSWGITAAEVVWRIGSGFLYTLPGPLLARLLQVAKNLELVPVHTEVTRFKRLLQIHHLSLQASRRYVPRPYKGHVTVFRATKTLLNDLLDATLGWGKIAKTVQVLDVPGDHWTMFDEPQVAILADRLRQSLEMTQVNIGGQIDPRRS